MSEDLGQDPATETAPEDSAAPPRRFHRTRRVSKWVVGTIVAVLLLVVAALALLNSTIGHRWVTDQIAKVAPASGLDISIGRIEGDLYGKATLHDVTLSDPKGAFLTVPLVDLDWRPISWLSSGLDVRELTTHRGTLLRMPELNPGDPDAPILPNFDIRIDKLAIQDLTIAKGVAGPQAHKANLLAKADIRDGRVMVKADGRLGAFDRVHALVDARPDGDTFDIDLDYLAPRDGVLAGLIGTKAGYRARVKGDGSWSRWNGVGQVKRDGENFAAFTLTNAGGEYTILGQAHPQAAMAAGLLRDLAGETASYKAVGRLENSRTRWRGPAGIRRGSGQRQGCAGPRHERGRRARDQRPHPQSCAVRAGHAGRGRPHRRDTRRRVQGPDDRARVAAVEVRQRDDSTERRNAAGHGDL